MGRKATALKSKSSTPVPLPHDGPIHKWLSSDDENPDDETDGVAAVDLVTTSLSLKSDNDIAGMTDSSYALTLVKDLQSASDIKVQLHTLQAFRSTVFNRRQQQRQETNSKSLELNNSSMAGLYRLLLEWSLSAQTPLPLQRAIQSAMQSLEVDDEQSIATHVLRSLWNGHSSCWKDPLHVLDVAVNFPPLCALLLTTLFDECLSFIYQQWIQVSLKMLQDIEAPHNIPDTLISTSLTLLKLLKILLQEQGTDRIIPHGDDLELFVRLLMSMPAMPTEGFHTLAIVYAKLYLRSPKDASHGDDDDDPFSISRAAVVAIRQCKDEESSFLSLPLFARVSVVQGIAATLDLNYLVSVASIHANEITTPLEECWKFFLQISQTATDSMVRWAALKGLSTLASRWKQCLALPAVDDGAMQQDTQSTVVDSLIQETLEVVLQAWENPPLRKVGTAIPGIFQTLVELLPESQLQELCRTIVNQPLNRKGRYLALEILLPYFPAEENSLISLDSLLDGVGDRGPNTGPIADLWIKLLVHAWNEQSKINEVASIVNWASQWVPSLSRALLEGDLSGRKQVTAFCIVRLLECINRIKSLQLHLSEIMILLLDDIGNQTTNSVMPVSSSASTESLMDRVLWAQLELARLLHIHKTMTPQVRASIASHIPLTRLRVALTHEFSALRLAAFQSVEAIVGATYNQGIQEEAEIWMLTLPYSIKTSDSNDYTTNILQCLVTFLDRFSVWEATSTMETDGMDVPLPRIYSFVAKFVIDELALRQGAYPGTVADKEGFTLALVESLLSWVLQDEAYSCDNNVVRNSVAFQRKRHFAEQKTMTRLLQCLLQQEVIAALFSMLHSNWDGTRSTAYRVISKLVLASQSIKLPLPESYTSDCGAKQLYARGLYLASSPRQREADTGSRMLAFVHIAKQPGNEQVTNLTELVDLLNSRLSDMRECLQSILFGDSHDGAAVDTGKRLPLAHGIIHSIFLIVQHRRLRAKTLGEASGATVEANMHLFEKLITIFCEAIQLSLNIVADVRDGEIVEGMDEETLEESDKKHERASAIPLNVNTGAIGANGTFSKLTSGDEKEHDRKLAIQRVVVGTWLLTKETCRAVAAVIAAHGFDPPPPLVQRVGTLLISTLVSLKHAGAAFAARDSLQEIALTCLCSKNDELRQIPTLWVDRLLEEISSPEKVRDSTLRRSTGYALGFVALMRSELAARSTKSSLCTRILKRLVLFSLPSESDLKRRLSALNSSHGEQHDVSKIFCAFESLEGPCLVPDTEYEARCRVHALNVLRMVILDAPLTTVVKPFIGDSIVSSLLGYNDPTWTVRNSSTMVFSATMLRVVDADKNASNTDRTSSQAITITELFRRYPPLSKLLPAMMEITLIDQDEQVNSQLFPILQIFARTQPVLGSGATSAIQQYPDLVFKALSNKHLAIRDAAARSLANICSDDEGNNSSFVAILKRCVNVLDEPKRKGQNDWNQIDGVLLVVKSLMCSSVAFRDDIRNSKIPSALLEMTRLKKGSLHYHPSCVATAFDVLTDLLGSDSMQELWSSCAMIQRCPNIENLPGGAMLYSSTARTAIKLIQRDIWEPMNSDEFADSLVQLEDLLSCTLIDVRLVATKAFKKAIYQNIDYLVGAGKGRSLDATDVLLGVAKVLLKCTSLELQRGRGEKGPLGAHVPTVRRLSRCLMECFDGYRILDGASVEDFVRATETDTFCLWSTAMAMVTHEDFLREPAIHPNGETFLSDNAAELMSIRIATEFQRNKLNEARLNTFSQVVCRLNDPEASWRSRYSAARAIEISHVLALPNASSSVRGATLGVVLEMLQDSDSDVRSCAARAAHQFDGTDGKINGGVSHSSLPVQALCRLFPRSYAVVNDDATTVVGMANSLVQAILQNTQAVVSAMHALDEELATTRTAGDPSNLTNSSSNRRIFEREDPNPCNERLLSNQLAIQALLRLPSSGCDLTRDAVDTMFRQLTSTLSFLNERLHVGGITHDMTRFGVIFSSLFGLLGAAASCIYHGFGKVEDFEETKRLAQISSSSTTFHPEILNLMNCIVNAKTRDDTTKKSIARCLFLLPPDNDGNTLC